MLEKVKAAYTNYWSLRLAAGIGLIVCAALLYWLPGGFDMPLSNATVPVGNVCCGLNKNGAVLVVCLR